MHDGTLRTPPRVVREREASVVVAGDSAGGNLTLALLLALTQGDDWPLPALGVCLCPWTDVTNAGASVVRNARHDRIERRMPERWACSCCAGREPGIR